MAFRFNSYVALAAVERKRRELSVLRLLGFSSAALVAFVVLQALYTGVFSLLLAWGLYGLAEIGLNRLFQQSPGEQACRLLLQHYLLALLATLLASAVALGLSRVLELPNISLILLAAVLVVAVRSSLGPAMACAGLSFLAYNFLFIPPTLTLTIDRQQDVLTLLFFLLMAGLTGNLASRQRQQLQALETDSQAKQQLLEQQLTEYRLKFEYAQRQLNATSG